MSPAIIPPTTPGIPSLHPSSLVHDVLNVLLPLTDSREQENPLSSGWVVLLLLGVIRRALKVLSAPLSTDTFIPVHSTVVAGVIVAVLGCWRLAEETQSRMRRK